mgnify:FL=1
MQLVVRNITKDNMVDFDNDHVLNLPMEEESLNQFLGKYEWIIVDGEIGDDYTDIRKLNQLLKEYGEENLRILCCSTNNFLINELLDVDPDNFIIIDFDAETESYNGGNGVICDDWWKGYLLFKLEYEQFPFKYTDEMEDYLKFEQLWYTAESEDWRATRYQGHWYLMKKF